MPFDLRTFSLKSPTVAAIDLQTVAQLRSLGFFWRVWGFFRAGRSGFISLRNVTDVATLQ